MSLKLTLQQALNLLSAAGVPNAEIVENETDSTYNQDEALSAIDTARQAIIEPKVLAANKDALLKEIEGKSFNSARSKISQLTGIPTAELKDLNHTEMIAKGLQHYQSNLGKDKEELIKERDTIVANHAKDKEGIVKDWEAKLKASEEKYYDKEILSYIAKVHKDAKGLPANVNRDELAKNYKLNLSQRAILKFNEQSGEVEMYDRANPDKRLFTNDSQTVYAKVDDFMKTDYTTMGLWNEDNRTVKPEDAMKGVKTDTYKPAGDPGTPPAQKSFADQQLEHTLQTMKGANT